MTSVICKKVIQLGSISILHSNWLPYASGCLISHCNGIPDINNAYTFADPIYKHLPVEEYHDILSKADILGLTCYVWNQSYNDSLSKYYKTLRPDGIVIYGGPQVPEDADLKIEYDEQKPWVNISIIGLGEIKFAEWLQGLPLSNKVLTAMPMPYTDGVFDTLLASDEKFKVSFETNRGCPYKCAFCDWGGQSKSKLTRFDINDVYKTIDYIYRYANINELEILDANFGILEQDIAVVDYMISCQDATNNKLKISYSGLAKNGSKHLPIILQKIFSQIPIDQRNLKISFQTHTPEVLSVIKRSNIDNNRLIPLIEEYRAQSIPITSEMIIAMPGETADSWLKTLDYNYHTLNIDYIRTYILHMVANTDMNQKDFREKYNVKTKNITYKNQTVEIMHQCYSFDVNELIKMFDYHWFYHNMVNTDLIKPQITNVYADCKRFFENLHNMPIINSLIERQRELVNHIFKDEPETHLRTDLENAWFSATMRQDDIVVLCANSDKVEQELKTVFPDNLNVDWYCEHPIRSVSIIK
jgi:tRNA A37 methylthiotransferase MiaB